MAALRAVKTFRSFFLAPAAVVMLGLLAGPLLAALAVPASASALGPDATDGAFDVSPLQYEPANPAGSAFWMWVNVTNGGTEAVENVSASISGAKVITPPDTKLSSTPTLGRGTSHSEHFEVLSGASIAVSAMITSRAGLATIRVAVTSPTAKTANGGTGRTSSVNVAPADITNDDVGTWTATVTQETGLTAVTCSFSITVTNAPAQPTQTLDNLSAGDAHVFRWMVGSSTPPDPPASAVVVVTATVGSADETFTAALGKPVTTGSGGTEGGPAPPVDLGLAAVVIMVWLLVPLAARERVRGPGARQATLPVPGFVSSVANRIRALLPPSTVGDPMLRKVPEITLYFWVIKVLCTTVGETAADQLNGTSLGNPMALGLSGTNLLMVGLLALALVFQFTLRNYIPSFYWVTVVLISVAGTLITDHLHDDLGVGLEALTVFFAVALAVIFAVWFASERTLSIHSIYTTRREAFYWAAILATFALGTASGDLTLERFTAAFGQVPSPDDPTVMIALHPQAALMVSAGLFAAVIGFCYIGWRYVKLNAVLMFWIAYIFTRPLGANLGDILTLAPEDGGMGLDKIMVNFVFFAAIVGSVYYLTVTKKDVFKGEDTSRVRTSARPASARMAARPDE